MISFDIIDSALAPPHPAFVEPVDITRGSSSKLSHVVQFVNQHKQCRVWCARAL